MRVSAIWGDRGYTEHGGLIKIYLDDIELIDCIVADEELGLVKRQVSRTCQIVQYGEVFIDVTRLMQWQPEAVKLLRRPIPAPY